MGGGLPEVPFNPLNQAFLPFFSRRDVYSFMKMYKQTIPLPLSLSLCIELRLQYRKAHRNNDSDTGMIRLYLLSKNKHVVSSYPCPNITACYFSKDAYVSCHEALKHNAAKEGYFPIRHKAMMRLVVPKCVKRGNDVTAEFGHDSEAITDVNGYDACGSYR